jgi:MFS family permease
VLAASLFGLALGEELWQAYVPVYLTALGAGGVVVGLFGSLKDLLDSVYQYPGGWLADRIGRRRALLVFTGPGDDRLHRLREAPAWAVVFIGLFGRNGLEVGERFRPRSPSSATLYRAIGGRWQFGFSPCSSVCRVSSVHRLAGCLSQVSERLAGIRVALIVTVALAALVLMLQRYGFREEAPLAPAQQDSRRFAQSSERCHRR